jgi:phosphoglucosamine mutase
MARRYFGTDGIRGRVGEAPITPEFVMRIGHAAGKVLAQRTPGGQRPSVLIGKDTRISGYLLEASLEAGLSAAGVDVLLSGPLPTPGVAYLTRALRLSAGIVISASHNPFDDNGIKFFSGDGNKLPDETEMQIEAALEQPMGCVASEHLGKARRIDDAAGRYIEFCKRTFSNDLDLRGMKIVVDCAHGAAYQTAPHVFHELGAEVVTVGASPNGLNINDRVGATHPASLVSAVREHRADVGIALDGDADRLLVCDRDGRLYDGDELLYLIVCGRMERGPVAGAAGTLMSNVGLERAFQRMGVAFARAKVGDRYVLELLQQRGWLYGGEGSGHLLCLDCHTTGDGTISALQVLETVRRSGRELAQLTSGLALYPQVLLNARVERDFDWKSHAPLVKACEGVERELGEDGRVRIRPSGTEPLLRVMVEARDLATAERLARELVGTLPRDSVASVGIQSKASGA